jgi:hypothetical protein
MLAYIHEWLATVPAEDWIIVCIVLGLLSLLIIPERKQ